MVKKGLGPEAKKEYVKPEITKNEPLVDVTFGTPTTTTTTTTTTTSTAGTLTGTAGSPGTLITFPKLDGGGDPLDEGTLGDDYDAGTLTGTGTVIPGTGGAPGTVL
jgi:hypothetical protein